MSIEDNKAVVRRFIEEAINQGQIALLDELCSPDFIYSASFQPNVRTREDIKRLLTEQHSAFPDVHFTIEDMLAEGEQVAVRYTMHATNTGDVVTPIMRLSATGKQITAPGIFIFRFAGGKVVETWHEADSLSFYQQLGLISMLQPAGS